MYWTNIYTVQEIKGSAIFGGREMDDALFFFSSFTSDCCSLLNVWPRYFQLKRGSKDKHWVKKKKKKEEIDDCWQRCYCCRSSISSKFHLPPLTNKQYINAAIIRKRTSIVIDQARNSSSGNCNTFLTADSTHRASYLLLPFRWLSA